GGGLVSVSGASGSILIDPGGVHGTLSGTVTVGVPGSSFSVDADIEIDTRSASRRIAVVLTDLAIEVAGQSLHGTFTFEQTTDAAGADIVKVTVASTGTAPFLALTAGDDMLLEITEVAGQLLITPQGVTGSLTFTDLD